MGEAVATPDRSFCGRNNRSLCSTARENTSAKIPLGSNIAKDMLFADEKRQVALQQIMRTDAQKVWDEFRKLPDGARY